MQDSLKFGKCEVCNKNYETGRKHVYSSFHKLNIDKLICRFIEKVIHVGFWR